MNERPGAGHEQMSALKSAAKRASRNAYAKYSNFPVGAAVLDVNGAVFTGCNVENASYGLTICAERGALAQAVAQGCRPGDIVMTLIYTPGDVAHTPCGACRQVMDEVLAPDATVVSCCDSEDSKTWTMSQLLPDPFRF